MSNVEFNSSPRIRWNDTPKDLPAWLVEKGWAKDSRSAYKILLSTIIVALISTGLIYSFFGGPDIPQEALRDPEKGLPLID